MHATRVTRMVYFELSYPGQQPVASSPVDSNWARINDDEIYSLVYAFLPESRGGCMENLWPLAGCRTKWNRVEQTVVFFLLSLSPSSLFRRVFIHLFVVNFVVGGCFFLDERSKHQIFQHQFFPNVNCKLCVVY